MKHKLGATGQFPRGKMNTDDEGELQFAVGSDPDKHKVIINFGKPVAWIGISPADAEQIAQSLIKHARRARGGDDG
jgi:hypothetical protein